MTSIEAFLRKRKDRFRRWQESMRATAQRNRDRDRGFDRHVGKFSMVVWPIREAWLPALVAFVCTMDFASTYFALTSGNPHVAESGPLAGWAIRTGGFARLFLVDVFSAATMLAIAGSTRYLYLRSGLRGYARAALVVLLLPYVVRTAVAVVNNIVVGFLSHAP